MTNTRLTVRVQAAAEKLSTGRNLRRLQLTWIQEGSHCNCTNRWRQLVIASLGTSLPGFTVSAGGTVAASAAVSDATILSLAKAGVLGSVLYAVASNKMPDGILGSRDDRNGFGGLKKTYNSIKDSPKYPEGFRPRKNGTTRNTVKNKELLDKLREIESGGWKKVYKDGYNKYGDEVSIHYFQSESGTVFDVKVKTGWSN